MSYIQMSALQPSCIFDDWPLNTAVDRTMPVM